MYFELRRYWNGLTPKAKAGYNNDFYLYAKSFLNTRVRYHLFEGDTFFSRPKVKVIYLRIN